MLLGSFEVSEERTTSLEWARLNNLRFYVCAQYSLICTGSMLLLPVLLATLFWSRGDMQSAPVQTPEMHHQMKGRSASMSCRLMNEDIVHWYKQLPGEPPKRILYLSGHTSAFDDSNDRNRFEVRKDATQPLYGLTIKSLTPRDSGTYYCAYWHYTTYLLFGSGTKLIVSNKGSSPPANSEILQKKHENQIMYVCLIEKFYPEVIRVTWTDEEKEITENVVKGDAWQPTEEDEYSVATWLTVPADNKDKKYYCKYEHESQKNSLPSQVNSTKNAPQEGDCSAIFNRDVTFPDVTLPDHLMHRTAYLVYIILLLKSNMYYLIILFFIYRMRSPTKHQGKKV
ncbi:PREDICTED: TCR gamma alternate reading frame protein [Lepidothrix coronata]|uniref:TCR gamma alternate reading frame protein n=1 Tax=Lepidothrix coronata TaxID=321398 RepID=UPI00081A076F|nr:PREDICTED: TCR gamma alternate reading frame protein [Lepidothrix coronata]